MQVAINCIASQRCVLSALVSFRLGYVAECTTCLGVLCNAIANEIFYVIMTLLFGEHSQRFVCNNKYGNLYSIV